MQSITAEKSQQQGLEAMGYTASRESHKPPLLGHLSIHTVSAQLQPENGANGSGQVSPSQLRKSRQALIGMIRG